MGRYIIRRLLQAIPLLFLLSIAMFLLIHAMPGGPDEVLNNPNLDNAGQQALRAEFGLDQPLYIQYFKWLGNSLVGNFGFSFSTHQRVSEILAQRLPATLQLFGVALVVALGLAILLGVLSAVRQNTSVDYILTVISYFGIALPAFILGLFLQDIFAVQLHLLPVSGTTTLGVDFDPFNAFYDHFLHLILPTLTLSLLFVASWSRYMRSSTIEVLKQDYMRTARAKGASPVAMLFRHALRNAVIPLITVVAIEFGSIAGGATITERIYAWPGMGSLFFYSLEVRDYPVLLAMLVLSGTFVIFFNLVADVLYGIMDPRIRYS
ncbi:ABC transporter permease [Tengunoibacter tsumagoiensis]|uniref:Peptide ABC transporter permease n=1 Tax=Tengunoibacter tsumagoiensis TaxID=2014871 RepID=A0A401ZXR7_9CHLR|nr:ABC transporter permease [Tengunoibacter tsumagoiensis]GCE11625.1 peptide ABC transporter permease [Tengunoibacter tsumagoiensis]